LPSSSCTIGHKIPFTRTVHLVVFSNLVSNFVSSVVVFGVGETPPGSRARVPSAGRRGGCQLLTLEGRIPTLGLGQGEPSPGFSRL
jgi:hypothetical protein